MVTIDMKGTGNKIRDMRKKSGMNMPANTSLLSLTVNSMRLPMFFVRV